MVLSDDASDAPDIEGVVETPYRYQAGCRRRRPRDHRRLPGPPAARHGRDPDQDYNYRTPEQELLADSSIDPEQAVGIESDYGTRHGQGRATATVRNEEIESTRP